MHEIHYKYIKGKFNSKLLFTDPGLFSLLS